MSQAIRYTRKQINQLIADGLITQDQVDKKVKDGSWEVSERSAAPKKEKEFHSDQHKAFYEAQQKMKDAIKPMFDEIKNSSAVKKFLGEWGKWTDEKGDFDLSIEWYLKGVNRAEKTFGE